MGQFVYSYGEGYRDQFDPYDLNRRLKWEVSPLLLIIIVSIAFAVVPTIKGVYGVTGGWCWIRGVKNCKEYKLGIVEQWALWYVWQILLLLILPIVLGYGTYRSRRIAQNNPGEAEFLDRRTKASIVVLIVYVLVYPLVTISELIIRVVDIFSTISSLAPWIVLAVVAPLGSAMLPLLALLYLYCSGKFLARRQAKAMQPPAPVNDNEREPLVPQAVPS